MSNCSCSSGGGYGCTGDPCTCANPQHKWIDDHEILSSYEMASSYESGNEYAPYTTHYVYGDKVIGRHCVKCGKTELY